MRKKSRRTAAGRNGNRDRESDAQGKIQRMFQSNRHRQGPTQRQLTSQSSLILAGNSFAGSYKPSWLHFFFLSRQRHRSPWPKHHQRSSPPSQQRLSSPTPPIRQRSDSTDSDVIFVPREISPVISVSSASSVENLSNDPKPTFLSVCRYLKTLEEYLGDYSSDIKSFFQRALDMERQATGSSNKLLTDENEERLTNLKNFLKDKIEHKLIPEKMLGIARTFVNEFLELMENQL